MRKAKTILINKEEPLTLHIFHGRISWGIVVLLLLYLPFQLPLHKYLTLPYWFLWIDEVLIVSAFGMFVLQGKFEKKTNAILLTLFLLVTVGAISTAYNANPLVPSAGGIFNYIKCFLVIPVFCFFSISKRRIIGLYKLLHILALFFCLFAILQEAAFFLGFPVNKLGVYYEARAFLRFGFMRTPSLMFHPNAFGLYSFFFFVLDLSLHRRLRWQNLLLLSGIALSGARVVWAVLFFILCYFLAQKHKKILLFFIFLLPVLIGLVGFYVSNSKEMNSVNYYRKDMILTSIEIWKDNPVVGVGPGMYGGWVKAGVDSPVFQKYKVETRWIEMMEKHRTLDTFWFQCLAEYGLFGTLVFIILLITLWRVAREESLTSKDPFRERTLFAFSAMPFVVAAYLFTNVLNVTAFLLTYTMLFGMVLGMEDESTVNQ